MAKTLLIQPEGSRPRLLEAVKATGRGVIERSFIEIEAVACQPVSLEPFAGIIWISKNAVKLAKRAGFSLSPNNKMYAVGPATAELACDEFKATCQCPTARHDSEALLSFEELTNCSGQAWAIMKGQGGRKKLSETLTERGARVTSFEVYQRTPRPPLPSGEIQQWCTQVDTIVVTSAEQLRCFWDSIPTSDYTWLLQCHWVVPSERIALLLRQNNCHTITITQSASENAMMEVLTSADNSL